MSISTRTRKRVQTITPPARKATRVNVTQMDIDEEPGPLIQTSYIRDHERDEDGTSVYVNRKFKMKEMPDYLFMKYIRRLCMPRITHKTENFHIVASDLSTNGGEGTIDSYGDFMMCRISPSKINTIISGGTVGTMGIYDDTCDPVAYSSVLQAYEHDGVAIYSDNTVAPSAANGSNFLVGANRQSVLWFGQMNRDYINSICSQLLKFAPLTATYLSGTQSEIYTGQIAQSVLIRGQSRKITIMNNQPGTMIVKFYECACINDCDGSKNPLKMWKNAIYTTEGYNVYPGQVSTEPMNQNQKGFVVGSTTLVAKNHYLPHSAGADPSKKGLYNFHKYWQVSNARVVKVAHGEKLTFYQNHDGAFYCQRDDGQTFYMEGISTGTIVTIHGDVCYPYNNTDDWIGTTHYSSCSYVLKAETTSYYEGQIPIIPHSLEFRDKSYHANPAVALTEAANMSTNLATTDNIPNQA